jgi:hypothetical protein
LDNIRIIKTGINVSKIKSQLEKYKDDWGNQKQLDSAEQLDKDIYTIRAGVLQLVMGAISKQGEMAYNTELCVKTPAHDRHTEIIGFIRRHFHSYCRCGFLSLPVDDIVGQHIDQGTYYQTKDRYHLSIQGRYDYTVGGETVTVEPGTLLWFNNKLMHGTKNVGDCTRITFVFDVPHSKKNP